MRPQCTDNMCIQVRNDGGDDDGVVFGMMQHMNGIALGNHDTGDKRTVEHIVHYVLPGDSRYMCANCKFSDGRHMTTTHKLLYLEHSSVLTFGMMYSFHQYADNMRVVPVNVRVILLEVMI